MRAGSPSARDRQCECVPSRVAVGNREGSRGCGGGGAESEANAALEAKRDPKRLKRNSVGVERFEDLQMDWGKENQGNILHTRSHKSENIFQNAPGNPLDMSSTNPMDK